MSCTTFFGTILEPARTLWNQRAFSHGHFVIPSPSASDGSHYEKRGKGESVCIDDEIPFEIPGGWEWVRLDSILTLNSGLGYKKGDLAASSDRMIRVLRGGNISLNDKVELKPNDIFISEQFVDPSLLLTKGQIITPAVTSLENVGKAALIKEDIPDTVCGGFVFFLTLPIANEVLSHYLHCFFTSPAHREFCKTNVKKSGQAFYNLSKAALNQALIAIPPLAEQCRIVAKVDELMPLVEEYGRLEDAREALNASLPDRLRKSVLQLAAEGKLVEQDPADEPASALLDRIREERACLVKEKKLKPPKGGESVIYRGSDGGHYEKRGSAESIPIDVPFEIPRNWEWCRLGSFVDMQAGKNISASSIAEVQDDAHPYPCYGGNGLRGYVKHFNRSGQFPIIGRQGALCGCINYAEGEFYATEHAVVTTCFCDVDIDWCGETLRALNLNQYATATAQPGLAVSKISEILIPVPPLAEQRRIVDKVNELLTLLDVRSGK